VESWTRVILDLGLASAIGQWRATNLMLGDGSCQQTSHTQYAVIDQTSDGISTEDQEDTRPISFELDPTNIEIAISGLNISPLNFEDRATLPRGPNGNFSRITEGQS
jgi:hypothetical protein